MKPIEALKAIEARIQGRWDNPELVKFGLLRANVTQDILDIVEMALKEEKKKACC